MIVPGRYRRLRCGKVTTATAALRTVGSVGRVTEKGRTATVDDQTDRVQTRRSLTGQEQPRVGRLNFLGKRTMVGFPLMDEVAPQ
jgi:hypothetical protein